MVIWERNNVYYKPRKGKNGLFYPGAYDADGNLWEIDGEQIVFRSPSFGEESDCEDFCKQWSKMDHKA